MKNKKKLLALALLGAAVGISAFALSGCSDNGKGNDPSTDITDPNVPLDPGGCKHTDVSHVEAKAAGCETGGNKEYWFCDDCDKYFSDEELTVETSLAGVTLGAAGHSYGNLISESSATCEKTGIIAHYHCSVCDSDFDADKNPVTDLVIPVASHTYGAWIEEEAATCTEDGVKAHKDCSVCEKHFDADNNEIADLVIVAGHAYGNLIAEVPAAGCTAGVKAHYHCDACNTDFDENKVEFNGLPFPIGNGLITIPAPHNIKDYPAEEASCIVDGHGAYRQCEDCEEYFDEFGNISFEEPVFVSGTHSYGEFVYDYTTKSYVKTCNHESTHTVVQAAGTEEYPYLANDGASLISLIEVGGYIKLVADIDLTETETETKTYYVITYDTTIDLDGHKITTKKGFSAGVNDTKFNAEINPTVTVINGTIERVSDTNIATLSAADCGELVIDNCTVVSTGDTAVSIFDQGKVTATNSTLKGVYYGLGSNAGSGNYSTEIYAKLVNCKVDAQYAGLLWNIPATLVIENCEISGIGQAVIARGGNVTISDTTLIKRAGVEGVDSDRAITGDELIYKQYETKNWSSGSYVPGYALVVGNRSTGYQYATNLTLNKVKVEVEEEADAGKYVYAYGNTNKTAGAAAYGATITYDEKCELGKIVLGDENLAGGSTVTVNAPAEEAEQAA